MSGATGTVGWGPIEIERREALYHVTITPPDGERWTSPAPMDGEELVTKLLALGCRAETIGDAFFAADRDWIERLRAPGSITVSESE